MEIQPLLQPWGPVAGGRSYKLERELERELAPAHLLAGKTVRAVAMRFDQDDVLFELADGGYAVVHLTWSRRREQTPDWPSTELFESLEEWQQRGMQPDHDDFSAGE